MAEKKSKKQSKKAIYAKYHSPQANSSANSAARSNRNKARRILGLKVGDGFEVHHKDGNPMNNSRDNLQKVKKGKHRAKDRGTYRKH